MSERPVIVVGAPGEEDACAAAAHGGSSAVGVLYLAAIDCLVVDLASGACLTVPAGILEDFAGIAPAALRGVGLGEDGSDLGLSGAGPRVAVADLLAGRFGSPDWMAGHAVRARNLRAGQLRRLTRATMAELRPPAP